MEKNCQFACSKVIKFFTDKEIGPNMGISQPPYNEVDGYRYLNLFVQFNQESANELPVNLGVIFAFDGSGTLGSRRYVNLESNVPASQGVNFVDVSGAGTWHGSPHNRSTYTVRIPVMGPYVEVFPFNKHDKSRKVSIWGYLTT